MPDLGLHVVLLPPFRSILDFYSPGPEADTLPGAENARIMQASPYTTGSIFALFVLPALIIAAAIVFAVLLKEKGE